MAFTCQDTLGIPELQAKIKDLETYFRDPFFGFVNLSYELRTLIWEYALSDRRVFRIFETYQEDSYDLTKTFFCSARLPVVLYVCKESREVALAHFRPFFEESWHGKISRPIYIRPELDILYIDSLRLGNLALDYLDINKIESIAIPSMTRLLLVKALGKPWPSNRCCATIELSPDAAGKQKESEWAEYIATQRRFPNVQQVKAVVGELVCDISYL
ncbi:hypothetical protein F5Y03DRAFT_388341 [Xylaria venustula]|nr:hypothetical protein F5Y03DRAFT_388341 [Xylaria venustula]